MFKKINKIYNKVPILNKLYNLNIRQKYFAILIGIIIIYIYLFFSGLPDPNSNFTICMFKRITHIPCASCGTTRGLKYFVHGYFYKALLMNPLSYVTVLASIISFIWIPIDLVKKQETFFSFINRKVPIWFIIIVIILTIANWIWNIYKGV